MAHTFEHIEIDGTKIKIAVGVQDDGTPGISKTVNVYDHTNTEGNYREIYRLPNSIGLTAASIARVATLSELEVHLLGLGATKEGPRKS